MRSVDVYLIGPLLNESDKRVPVGAKVYCTFGVEDFTCLSSFQASSFWHIATALQFHYDTKGRAQCHAHSEHLVPLEST